MTLEEEIREREDIKYRQGVEQGIQQGLLQSSFRYVSKGYITAEAAAEECGLSEEDFSRMMKEYMADKENEA